MRTITNQRAAYGLLASALLTGCSGSVTIGGDDKLDSKRMADSVGSKLRESWPGVQIDSVTCAKGVKVAEGATLQCTAAVAGQQLPVKVTLSHVRTGGDTQEFDYEVEATKALLDTDKVIDELRSQLPAQAAGAKVDCGTPRLRVVEVGKSITCTISLGSKRQVEQVVVENVDGTSHFQPANVWPATPTKPATGKIGDTLTVSDAAGAAQLQATVTRLKFSSGDDFDQPEHGLFMGAFVKLRALADDQEPVEFAAVVGGHTYTGDAIVTSTTFDPALDPLVVGQGDQASGWVVFDVPTRHGQLVMRDVEGHQLAAWKY